MDAAVQTDIEHDVLGTIPSNDVEVRGRLLSIIERAEHLADERRSLGGDLKDVFSEAKAAGYDVKVLKLLLRLRKMEPAEIEAEQELLDVYRRALGM